MTPPGEYELLDDEPLYEGFMQMRRLSVRHTRFDGGWSPLLSRELLVREAAVAVLPYDPVRDEVVLIEQFRVGACLRPGNPWLLEVVAGLMKPGEQPEEVAHRETAEETGLAVQALLPMHHYFSSPGGSAEFFHLYLGRVDARDAGGVHGLADEHEDIRVHPMPLQDALARLAAGDINNALTIIGLQWLALHREQVREQWR